MSYEVRLLRGAHKELDSLPGRDFEAIAEAISGLETNPRPPHVKKLVDSDLWRIRLRHYRIIYVIDDKARVISLVRIAWREEDTYRGL